MPSRMVIGGISGAENACDVLVDFRFAVIHCDENRRIDFSSSSRCDRRSVGPTPIAFQLRR